MMERMLALADAAEIETVGPEPGTPPEVGWARELHDRLVRLGIAQFGDPVLTQPAKPLDLPRQRSEAERIWLKLRRTAAAIRRLYQFGDGMGLAAPQLRIARRIALIAPPGRRTFCLINPEILDQAPDYETRYEGCLSFFHVRGLVERPHWIVVRWVDLAGQRWERRFESGLAGLVLHEVDHLDGRLYLDHLADPSALVDIDAYHSQLQPHRRRRTVPVHF